MSKYQAFLAESAAANESLGRVWRPMDLDGWVGCECEIDWLCPGCVAAGKLYTHLELEADRRAACFPE